MLINSKGRVTYVCDLFVCVVNQAPFDTLKENMDLGYV